MKRWVKCAVAVGVLGTLLVVVRPLRAGEYHSGIQLICSDCHTMHYSEQHDYSGGPGRELGPGGPHKHLLRYEENELCKSCHDGQTFAPDVVGDNTGTHVRQAGALTTGASPYEDWKGHTLDSMATAPGGTWSNPDGLKCVNCHHHHGFAGGGARDVKANPVSSAYRNLRAMATYPGGGNLNVSYAKGTNNTDRDVFLRGWTLGDIANNYSVANVDFNEPVSSDSGIGRWCMGCHNDFHGKKGDANMGGSGTGGTDWLRHPTADANIGQTGMGGYSSLPTFRGRLYRVKVMSPTGDWGTQGTAWATAPNDLTQTCVSCHKVHGNQNPFGLIYLWGTGPITEEGDTDGNAPASEGGGMRRLCKQCHVQGGST